MSVISARHRVENLSRKRLGITSRAKNGMEMTIIGYDGEREVTVKFEDGAIVSHRGYREFVEGDIAHPTNTVARRLRLNHINETNRANCGLMMKIIAYNSKTNVDVAFEDGIVKRGITYRSFRTGEVAHPTAPKNRPFPISVYGFTLQTKAYEYNTELNYICKCNRCGLRDVMTTDEMKKHICKGVAYEGRVLD